METPFFSIIVPIYKVEKYLNQCVDAIINQTLKKIEIILVDDGSPDSCPQICDEYARLDSRVKVVHKQNGGLSDARNAGLIQASGEYVVFKDSDDYWDDDKALEKIKKIIDESSPDVVTWRRKKIFEEENRLIPIGYDIDYSLKKDFNDLFRSRNFDVSACCKAIKKNLFDKNDLLFEKGVTSEDMEWCARLLACVNTISVSNLDFYVYRKRSGSITNTIGERNISDVHIHLEKIKEILKTVGQEKKQILRIFLAEQFCNYVITVSRSSCHNQERLWIKNNKKLLKVGCSKRSKLLRLLLNTIGVKNTLRVISKIG